MKIHEEALKETTWISGIANISDLALNVVETDSGMKYLVLPKSIRLAKINDGLFIILEEK